MPQQLRIERQCPSCESEKAEPTRIRRDEWTVVRCSDCGFVYLRTVPHMSELTEAFAWDQSVIIEKQRRKRETPLISRLDALTRWRLHITPRPETRKFLSALAAPGPVLDLGCGDGRHAMALDEDYIPFGVEIAPALADAAHQAFESRGGGCVSADAVAGLDSFAQGIFSGAMLNSYLEHEWQPLDVLAALRDKMKPGAPVIVKVPNFGSWNAKVMGLSWCGIRLPDHVNYFTWKSLKTVCQQAGYSVSAPRMTNLPTNDNMWAILYRAA